MNRTDPGGEQRLTFASPPAQDKRPAVRWYQPDSPQIAEGPALYAASSTIVDMNDLVRRIEQLERGQGGSPVAANGGGSDVVLERVQALELRLQAEVEQLRAQLQASQLGNGRTSDASSAGVIADLNATVNNVAQRLDVMDTQLDERCREAVRQDLATISTDLRVLKGIVAYSEPLSSPDLAQIKSQLESMQPLLGVEERLVEKLNSDAQERDTMLEALRTGLEDYCASTLQRSDDQIGELYQSLDQLQRRVEELQANPTPRMIASSRSSAGPEDLERRLCELEENLQMQFDILRQPLGGDDASLKSSDVNRRITTLESDVQQQVTAIQEQAVQRDEVLALIDESISLLQTEFNDHIQLTHSRTNEIASKLEIAATKLPQVQQQITEQLASSKEDFARQNQELAAQLRSEQFEQSERLTRSLQSSLDTLAVDLRNQLGSQDSGIQTALGEIDRIRDESVSQQALASMRDQVDQTQDAFRRELQAMRNVGGAGVSSGGSAGGDPGATAALTMQVEEVRSSLQALQSDVESDRGMLNHMGLDLQAVIANVSSMQGSVPNGVTLQGPSIPSTPPSAPASIAPASYAGPGSTTGSIAGSRSGGPPLDSQGQPIQFTTDLSPEVRQILDRGVTPAVKSRFSGGLYGSSSSVGTGVLGSSTVMRGTAVSLAPQVIRERAAPVHRTVVIGMDGVERVVG
mmetsp:Transcript_30511/g.64684  ORF Transcript_30511/g.64684 Transcript_30511/m.64684 type:complete len:692 (-) Transcript_30511:78-2153(-)